jgi:hypothetical protein
MLTSQVRSSELFQRYFEQVNVIARSQQSMAWEPVVERIIRRFHTETMAMIPTCFQQLRDGMSAEFEESARRVVDARKESIFLYAAKVLSEMK